LLVGLIVFSGASGQMEVLPHEEIEVCNEHGEPSRILDLTALQLVVESDDDYYLNGTVKFLVPIRSPWEIYAFGERFYRDAWTHGAEKKMSDFCAEMKDPKSPSRSFLKDKKKCPFEAGVSRPSP
jgi:hypothetical protein